MTTYIDSSALVAVYVPERHSPSARKALRAVPQVPFTQLHELEVANAFALLLGHGTITAVEHRAIGAQLRDDIEARRLVPITLDWPQTFAGACDLSASVTSTLLTRSLDLLHVATARVLDCTVFVSADDRQLAVAKTAGLKAVDIKRAPVRSPLR